MRDSDVVIVHDSSRAEGAIKALQKVGLPEMIGKNVLIKPNFNTSDPAPGSTHNDTLRTVLEIIIKEEPEKIIIGDRSGPEDTRGVFEEKGIFHLSEEMGFDCLIFDEMEHSRYQLIKDPRFHWKSGFLFAKPILEADVVISLCCLKTHQYGGHFTMSLKNTTGMVHRDNMRELHHSPHQREMIAEMNTAYKPDLILMDGVEAFYDGGPMTGSRWKANITLASKNRVAIDAVGVAALKKHGTTRPIESKKVFDQDQIRRAVDLGLGASSPDEIRIVAVGDESQIPAEELEAILKI
ncbi:MAG: DUF362 domain-containing protein [Methanomassiliicoccales archaeon]|nr:DUF362 domain-containing protein [Methanomassiliicoccales archaeon]NYT16066.1 DUF362 domain-containing protein [Methanomassiliicoccales archaeon]